MSDAYTEFAPLKYDQREIAQKGYGSAASGATETERKNNPCRLNW